MKKDSKVCANTSCNHCDAALLNNRNFDGDASMNIFANGMQLDDKQPINYSRVAPGHIGTWTKLSGREVKSSY